MRTIDLNADLGEGVTDDAGLLAVVTSANVACGYHAENERIMRAVCSEAASRGVVVGAQVSHVKPHGALYNRVVHDDEEQARAVLSGSGDLPVLGLPGSVLLSLAAEVGLAHHPEGAPTAPTPPRDGWCPATGPARCTTSRR